jgi:hypothetical protein
MADEYRAKVVILTGNPIERADLGRFIVDLETIKTHKDRLSVDFNHNEETPIGYIEDITYTPSIGLVGVATFSSPIGNDKSAEILQRLIDGFPFEVSPTLDLVDPERLEAGEKATVNGMEVEGELDIYRNVNLRGVGVVLFGTDPNTKITSLKQNHLITLSEYGVQTEMSKKQKLEDDALVKLADEEQPIEGGGEATETAEKKPEYLEMLEAFIEDFGYEKGVEYFRANKTIDEAREADYAELKALRAKFAAAEKEEETGDGEGGNDDGGNGEEAVTADDEEKKEDEEELKTELASLKAELVKLRAAFGSRGEDTPVSVASKKQEPAKLDPIHAMAEKIKRNGIKRA